MPDEPLKSLHTSQWHTHPAYLVKNSKSSEIWFPCWDCSPLSVIIWSVWHVTIHDLDPHHWSHNAPLHSQALRWSSVVLSRQNISWVNKCSTRGSPPTCTLVHFPVCSHLETCHPSHHPASGYSPTKLVKGTTNNQEQEATKTRIVRQLLDFERFWVFRVECGGWTYAPNKLQLPWSAWSFTLEDQNFSPEKCFDQGSVMYLLIFHDSMLHACLAMMFPLIPFVLCLKELCSAASGWVSPQSPWGATGTCRDQVMGVAWSQLKFDTRTIWQKLKYMSKMPDWGRPCGFPKLNSAVETGLLREQKIEKSWQTEVSMLTNPDPLSLWFQTQPKITTHTSQEAPHSRWPIHHGPRRPNVEGANLPWLCRKEHLLRNRKCSDSGPVGSRSTASVFLGLSGLLEGKKLSYQPSQRNRQLPEVLWRLRPWLFQIWHVISSNCARQAFQSPKTPACKCGHAD